MRKYFWIGSALILAAATAWICRTVWRARTNTVSLHVRNAPLAEVIDSLRRQSGELIVVDINLDTKITLELKNASLSDALKRVARQASALQGMVHAVYNSEHALGDLKSALRAGDAPEQAGWITLAPRLEGPMLPPGEPTMVPFGDGVSVGGGQVATEDVLAFDPGAVGHLSNSPSRIQGKEPEGAPMMVMRFQSSDRAGNVSHGNLVSRTHRCFDQPDRQPAPG